MVVVVVVAVMVMVVVVVATVVVVVTVAIEDNDDHNALQPHSTKRTLYVSEICLWHYNRDLNLHRNSGD